MDHKTLQLHVTVLNALVMGVLGALAVRDPELVRDVVMNEAFTDFASRPEALPHSAEDLQALQTTMDALLRPIRIALGEIPPE